MSFCQHPDCNHTRLTPVEGSTEFCATRNAIIRKQERIDNVPVKPLTVLRRSGKPKPVSDKRKEQNERYNKRVKIWLVGKMCAVYPHLKATQCHHRHGRTNELLEDETYWLPVSDEGHKFIHANSDWSREKGFMLLRSVTNKPTI